MLREGCNGISDERTGPPGARYATERVGGNSGSSRVRGGNLGKMAIPCGRAEGGNETSATSASSGSSEDLSSIRNGRGPTEIAGFSQSSGLSGASAPLWTVDSEPWSAGVSGIDKPKHHRGSSQSGSEHYSNPTDIATAASGAELFWRVAARSSSSACSAWYRNDAACIGFANTASGSESIGAYTCTGLADTAQGSTCGSESDGASSCKRADSGKAQACTGEEDAGCGKGSGSCSSVVRFGQGVISPSFEFAFRPCGRLHECLTVVAC